MIIFEKPENVLTLAGIALADLATLITFGQHVPTLHLAKTSFWSGTKINNIRFGSYPDTGLIELARAEAAARAGTWDAWAFAFVATNQTHQNKHAILVEAGDAPVSNTVRIIQEFHLDTATFNLRGPPLLSVIVQDKHMLLDEADASAWQIYLRKGIDKLPAARGNWDRWSAPAHQEVAPIASS